MKILTPSLTSFVTPLSIKDGEGNEFSEARRAKEKKGVRWILFWILIIGFTPSNAQTTFDPLTIGIGARALGMGKAYVAVAEDGDTIFNNPAGLGEIDHFKFTSMSGILLEEVNYTVLGGVFPLGKQTAFGFGFAGAYVTGIDIRDAGGTFARRANYGNSVAFASLGKKFSDSTSFGVNLKYYMVDATEIDSGDSQDWNLDLGMLQKGNDWLSFGLVGQNLVGSGTMPLTIKAGMRAAPALPLDLTLAVDARFSRDLSTGGGIELSPHPALTLRAGSERNEPTAGLTLKIAGFGFHYAYNINAQYFSITYDEHGFPPEGPRDVFLGCKDPSSMLK